MMLLAVIAAQQDGRAPDIDTDTDARRHRRHRTTDGGTGEKRAGQRQARSQDRGDAGICDVVLACVPAARTGAQLRDCVSPGLEKLAARYVPESLDDPRRGR
jgi:hypothetical protein